MTKNPGNADYLPGIDLAGKCPLRREIHERTQKNAIKVISKEKSRMADWINY